MKSLGIDLSLTATGIVVLEGFKELGKDPPKILCECEIKTKPMVNRFARVDKIISEIIGVINAFEPGVITVENYGVSKMQNGQIQIIELGAIMRAIFWAQEIHWLDPTPSELKKFVSGKGNTSKDLIPMHVLKRWGHQSQTNNTADAYGLAATGLAWTGQLAAMTQPMYDVIGALKLH